jgi:hypothetical protein
MIRCATTFPRCGRSSVTCSDVILEEGQSLQKNIDLIMLARNHQNLAFRLLEDSLAAKLLERCTGAQSSSFLIMA